MKRILTLLIATVCAFAQMLPPLVDIATSPEWLKDSGFKAAQVDARGNVIFAGGLASGVTIPGAIDIGPRSSFSGPLVIVKMDAQLSRVLSATRIGGSAGGEVVSSMQVRADGGVVLAGSTYSFDFPSTVGPVPGEGNATRTFLLVLGVDGKLEYSRVYPSQIFVQMAQVGTDGDVYIAGGAKITDLPSTAGAYTPDHPGNTFVARLAAGTMEPKFIVHLEDTVGGLQGLAIRPGGGFAVLMGTALIGLDAAGSRLDFNVAQGNSLSATLAAGADVYTVTHNTFSGMIGEMGEMINVHYTSTVQQYSLDGALLRTLDLAGLGLGGSIAGPDGTLYFGGGSVEASATTYNGLEPCNNNRVRPGLPRLNRQDSNLVIVDPSGNLKYASFVYYGAFGVSGNRYLYALGGDPDVITASQVPRPTLYRVDLQRIPAGKLVAPSCIANAASYGAGPATPGELMTIYGSGLGPDAGESFQVVNGRAPTTLAGTSVTVDGTAAPILYTQDKQINFIVPWGLRTQGTVQVCVTRGPKTSCLDSYVDSASLGVFSANGVPIVARQDWSLVTDTNRPLPGEVITLWMTGTGLLDSVPVDGEVAGLALRRTAAQVNLVGLECAAHGCRVLPDSPRLPVDYAGSAPGFVSGVTQVSVRIPGTGSTTVGPTFWQFEVGSAGIRIFF